MKFISCSHCISEVFKILTYYEKSMNDLNVCMQLFPATLVTHLYYLRWVSLFNRTFAIYVHEMHIF
jgi:hypothetical protein